MPPHAQLHLAIIPASVFFASLFSNAHLLCVTFIHPISQQSPIDFTSKSVLNLHHPVHPQCSIAASSLTELLKLLLRCAWHKEVLDKWLLNE